MDAETYTQEADKQLNDTNYYTKLPHDVTQLHEEKVKLSLNTLKNTT